MNFDSQQITQNQTSTLVADDDQDLDTSQSLSGVQDEDITFPAKEEPQATPAGTNFHKVDKILLTVGPLFLLLSIAISLVATFKTQSQPETFYQGEEQSWVPGISNQEYVSLAPENPNSVTAYSSSNMEEELQSGSSYSYADPNFVWDEGTILDPEADLAGYLVYFGPKTGEGTVESNPLFSDEEAYFVQGPHFSPSNVGQNLEPGTNYNLYIQTVSNGKISKGFDREIWESSKLYFSYIYE